MDFLTFTEKLVDLACFSTTVLAFYGIIPESVVQITSITTLKTQSLVNDFGEYAYHNIKERLMFRNDLKPMSDNRNLRFAKPEKALLDLLYLHLIYGKPLSSAERTSDWLRGLTGFRGPGF